jgi:RHS repeat-associated protein
MLQPGRSFSAGNGYRYGFNGKENDNEVKGEGNQIDYKNRIYDPRIGRFLSVDPLTHKYPMLTPYQFASNSPISGVDLDGLEYYYAADGNLIAKSRDNNTQVRVVQAKDVASAWQLLRRKEGATTADLNKISTDVGMNNAELNTRAFMSTLKQTENHGNDALPYNAMHGFTKGKLNTFTDKSYSEAPEDYKDHPYEGKKGGTAAGAYQLLRPTFNAQKKSNPLVTDFGPNSQDNAVLGIFNTKGIDALEPIKAGNWDLSVQRLIKDKWGNTQFASLPGGGQEASGMTMDKLKELIKKNISNELNNQSNISLPKGSTLSQ